MIAVDPKFDILNRMTPFSIFDSFPGEFKSLC